MRAKKLSTKHNIKLKNIHKKYIKNDLFQRWVSTDDKEVNEYWDNWMKLNPYLAEETLENRNILRSIQFKSYTPDNKSILKSWDQVNRKTKTGERSIGFYNVLKIAAVLSFFAISFFVVRYLVDSNNAIIQETSQSILIEKQAEKGTKLTVQLSDGSRIKLNSGSKIIYPEIFDADKREVQLIGEGYFEIAREEEREFIVKTDKLITTVLGTKFVINAFDKECIQVSLISGSVKVEEASSQNTKTPLSMILDPGYKAVFQNDELIQKMIDNLLDLGWKDDIIAFKNNDIKEIVAKLENWYGVEFEIRNNQNIALSFNGKYQDEVLVNVLNSIGHAMNFEYELKGNKVLIIGI